MLKRILRIVSLSLITLGLVAADLTLPWGQSLQSDGGRVLAQSRKRSKKKKKPSVRRQPRQRSTTSRRSLRRRTSARSRRRSRAVQLGAGRRIPTDRVLEIQRALVERGFLKEASGIYDDATVQAMKAFQTAEDITVTGYPTAHALHRLGLSPGRRSTTSATSKETASREADKPGGH